MPFEFSYISVNDRVRHLNTAYQNQAAIPILSHALNDPYIGRVALVSSFGAESVVLLHMISLIDQTTPVVFIDTQMMFPETIAYQGAIAEKFGLTDVRRITPDTAAIKKRDPFARLHLADTNACCALRKSEPLDQALGDFDAWITGRKRFQAGTREQLNLFEVGDSERIKINPLAHWRPIDVQDYIANNNLPRHPLVAQGYPSIGCAPNDCTKKVRDGDDPRSGRWANQDKTECGIHFPSGKANRHTALEQ